MTILRRIMFKTIDHINMYLKGPTDNNISFKDSLKEIYNDVNLGKYKAVIPDYVSPPRTCPAHIVRPPYVERGDENDIVPQFPEIKSAVEIEKIKQSCKLARLILDAASSFIKIGVTTDELDEYIHNLIISHNAYPSPLHYYEFPKSICTSVNNVICHGIPDARPLINGDIITVDVSVYLDGFHGDCASTFLVCDVDDKGKHLVNCTEEILMAAIQTCGPNRPFDNIGKIISSLTANCGLHVVPCVAGHGIGSYFHGPPDIYHTDDTSYPGTMMPGMTFTIEPALSQTSAESVLLDDGFTVVTEDDARAAQFEHTVLITDQGVEILT